MENHTKDIVFRPQEDQSHDAQSFYNLTQDKLRFSCQILRKSEEESFVAHKISLKRHRRNSSQIDYQSTFQQKQGMEAFSNKSRQATSDFVPRQDDGQSLLLGQDEDSSSLNLKEKMQSLCLIHQKKKDVICLTDKVRICSYCALFGPHHKAHTFKSQSQFNNQLSQKQQNLKTLLSKQQHIEHEIQDNTMFSDLEKQCKQKEKGLKDKLFLQFQQVVKKLEDIRDKMSYNIEIQSQATIKIVKELFDHYSGEIQGRKTYFEVWAKQSKRLIKIFKQGSEIKDFTSSFKQYDNFLWKRGEILVDEETQFLQKLKQDSVQMIADMNYNIFHPQIKLIIAETFFKENQPTSGINSSISTCEDQGEPKALKKKSLRNSINQFLEQKDCKFTEELNHQRSTLKEVKSSQKNDKMRFVCSPKNAKMPFQKKQNNYQESSNTSIIRFKSVSRLQVTAILPSHADKRSLLKSPKTNKTKKDPLKIILQYQMNKNATVLNLSNCNLQDEQLLYFIERGWRSHKPSEINVEKNKISYQTFHKLMPQFINCVVVNCSDCGLSEACLDLLLITRPNNKIREINLSMNYFNSRETKRKVELLKKQGYHVITQ